MKTVESALIVQRVFVGCKKVIFMYKYLLTPDEDSLSKVL